MISLPLRDPFEVPAHSSSARDQGRAGRAPKSRAVQRARYTPSLHWPLWEEAAARLERGDRFCSSPHWGLALAEAFHSRGELYVYSRGPHLAVFHEFDVEGGRLVMPCDTMWCLGSPLMSPEPGEFLREICLSWEGQGEGVRQITVGGLYADNPLWQHPLWQVLPNWEVTESGRQVASLEGGLDGFMSRRSVNFRSRLRRAVKKWESEGLQVEYWPHTADAETTLRLHERAMKVERQSWKGLAGQGVDRGQMRTFYQRMLPSLAAHGRLRGLFLTRDGQDMSYLFGASFAGYFRGLQFSYLESESDSLGNVGQWKMIESLVAEGCGAYDLGQAMAYKDRWAEIRLASPARAFQLGYPAN